MLSSSELTQKIIEKAMSLGASIAGIASVDFLKSSPSHVIYPKIGMNLNERFTCKKDREAGDEVCWPDDAVSAVVIGVEHPADHPELDWWDRKGTPGNRILVRINNHLAKWIEDTFHIKAYKLPYAVEKGGIFLKDAAVNAGLGCIGRNNLVITPQYGPRIRLRALLLNREAAPTESPAFNPCEGCGQPCRKACPEKAFQQAVYFSEDLGQSILPGINGTYDRVSCNVKMEKDIDDAAAGVTSDDKNQNDIRELIYKHEKGRIKEPDADQAISYCVRYCRRCELSCPVGIR